MSTESPPEIVLRPATPVDRDFLLELYGSTRAEELAIVPWGIEQKHAFIEMQFLAQSRAYAAYENAIESIVLASGVPAGRLYVDRRGDEIRVVDISLMPQFRGHGIGTALLRELMVEADLRQQRLCMHVEQYNRALRLYNRLGFVLKANRGMYLYLERQPVSVTGR